MILISPKYKSSWILETSQNIFKSIKTDSLVLTEPNYVHYPLFKLNRVRNFVTLTDPKKQ